MAKANLAEKLSQFDELWSPRIVAQFNDCDVMLAKVEGEFVWHKHDDTDDLFYVLDGTLELELRDQTVVLRPGDLYVVPRGVEHRPAARNGQVHLMVMEKKGTPNTGDHATAAKKKYI